MNPVKFGIISFAHVHADGYASALKAIESCDNSVRLVAVSDTDSARGKAKAEQWGARFYSDYRELLASKTVDAVIIASENARHGEEVTAAAAAGVHVICEKPVGMSATQLELICEAIERAGIHFQTAFVCRYSAPVVEAKKVIESGNLGAIRAISATNHGTYPGGWFGEAELSGGGAIIDHTVHAADVIRWFTGDEFTAVRAFRGKNLRSELKVEDNALIYARMKRSGIPVSIDCSWSRHDNWPIWGDLQLNIFCAEGALKIDAFKTHINVASNAGFAWHGLAEDLNVKLIRSFCFALAEKTAVQVDRRVSAYTLNPALRAGYDDGARAAQVALAAYASLAQSSIPVAP